MTGDAPCPGLLGPALAAYGWLWRAARPCLARHRRLKEGFAERLVPDGWARPADLWIQAASGGEAYLVWTLLRQAAKDRGAGRSPDMLLTTCTRQGHEVLSKAAKWFAAETGLPAPQVRFFPLDEPGLMARALVQAAPRAVLLLETELWPGFLQACRAASVPVLVGNGRLTAKSLRRYKLIPAAWWAYFAPQRILAMSEADAARFAALFGEERVEPMPNLKFESLLEAAAPTADVGRFFPPQDQVPVILFASTRKAELTPVAEAVGLTRRAAPEAIVVLAPRHLHHVPLWQNVLAAEGGAVKLRSQTDGGGDTAFLPGDIVIWDVFGELTALYAQARAAFVGGSLAPLGGQNFLEALSQGVAPVLGPSWDNFAWAADFVAPAGQAAVAANAAEVAQYLARQASAPRDRAAVRESFYTAVRSRQGGAAILWAAVREVTWERTI